MRKDKKPIAVAHVEGLLHYAVQKIQLLNNRGTRLFTLNEKFVQSLSRNEFEEFYRKWIEDRSPPGDQPPSPYEVQTGDIMGAASCCQ